MKISAIQNVYRQPLYAVKTKTAERPVNDRRFNDLSQYPCHNITFGTVKNAEGLRELFKYGIPDMYDGKIMIPAALFDSLLKSGVFQYPARYSVKFLKVFEESFSDIPYQVFQMVKKRASTHPDDDLQEIFQGLAKSHERKLRATQAPIFNDLIMLSEELPYKQQQAFDDLMYKTYNQLHGKPFKSTFDKTKFQYRLNKIREDMSDLGNARAAKIISKMIAESNNLPEKDNKEALAMQKEIINNLFELSQSNLYLKNYGPLQQLLASSIARLNKIELVIPFSRKAFIADLEEILENVRNDKLKKTMLAKAEELPTSKDAADAFILKYQDSPPDKIAYRLAHLRYSSVEHRIPKSKGGKDSMKNYSGASVVNNSKFGNEDLDKRVEEEPRTPENTQKQLDRFIELANKGKFRKHNIDLLYIIDYKNYTEQASKGLITLDISKLKEKPQKRKGK